MSEAVELTGKEKIVAELKALEYEFSVELPRMLRTAVAHGDLSENSEYKMARERQDYVRARVRTRPTRSVGRACWRLISSSVRRGFGRLPNTF